MGFLCHFAGILHHFFYVDVFWKGLLNYYLQVNYAVGDRRCRLDFVQCCSGIDRSILQKALYSLDMVVAKRRNSHYHGFHFTIQLRTLFEDSLVIQPTNNYIFSCVFFALCSDGSGTGLLLRDR